jgi:hypothetical protein
MSNCEAVQERRGNDLYVQLSGKSNYAFRN